MVAQVECKGEKKRLEKFNSDAIKAMRRAPITTRFIDHPEPFVVVVRHLSSYVPFDSKDFPICYSDAIIARHRRHRELCYTPTS